MSGKSLDELTPYGQRCYQQGVDDTHARYEQMQTQAREWLQAVIELIAEIERDEPEHSYARRVLAPKLRAAVSLDANVKLRATAEPDDDAREGDNS